MSSILTGFDALAIDSNIYIYGENLFERRDNIQIQNEAYNSKKKRDVAKTNSTETKISTTNEEEKIFVERPHETKIGYKVLLQNIAHAFLARCVSPFLLLLLFFLLFIVKYFMVFGYK